MTKRPTPIGDGKSASHGGGPTFREYCNVQQSFQRVVRLWPPQVLDSGAAVHDGERVEVEGGGTCSAARLLSSDQEPGSSEMTARELSAADAALRERIRELSVHIPCGGLRGPVNGRWQSCRDEDSPERWDGCDVSHGKDLCIICFRATAGGTSRWSWLACTNCLRVNESIARLESQYGDRPFALGRHSLMNRIGVRGGAPPEVQQEQIARLVAFAKGDDRLREWRRREYPRLASHFDPLADVPLRVWQAQWPPSLEASLDAFARLLGHQPDPPVSP
jgi:hypothetical protein